LFINLWGKIYIYEEYYIGMAIVKKGDIITSNKGQNWEVVAVGSKNATIIRRYKGVKVAEITLPIKDIKGSFKNI